MTGTLEKAYGKDKRVLIRRTTKDGYVWDEGVCHRHMGNGIIGSRVASGEPHVLFGHETYGETWIWAEDPAAECLPRPGLTLHTKPAQTPPTPAKPYRPPSITLGVSTAEGSDTPVIMLSLTHIDSNWCVFGPSYARNVAQQLLLLADHIDSLNVASSKEGQDGTDQDQCEQEPAGDPAQV